MPKKSKPPALPLHLLYEEYFRDLRRQDMSEKTIKDYRKVLHLVYECWEQHLKQPPTLEDVTIANAQMFLDHLLDRGNLRTHTPLSHETLRTYIRTLKAFTSWLADEKQGFTSEDRLRVLRLPKGDETYKRPLELDEIQAFINTCDSTTVLGARDLAMFLTLVDGGLRAMELARLTLGDVNLDSGQLFIATSKTRRSRVVAVGEETKRVLRRYAFLRDALSKQQVGSTLPFFQTKEGTMFTYNGLKQWMRRHKLQANVGRAHLHLLRHTSAVQTLEVPGSDLFTLQEKLGHADIATTRRYIAMATERSTRRQRTFSPVDHLGLGKASKGEKKGSASSRLWRHHRGED